MDSFKLQICFAQAVGNFSKKLVVVSAFQDIAKYINIDPNQIAYP